MPLDLSTCLKFYKRKDIQQAIVEHARNKEIGMRYNDKFGKRPDVLTYPKDVLELALNGVTSFHSSEEIWHNPLSISSELPKSELDQLRSGWDVVLDIDCPDWEFSKLTTYLFMKALEENQVQDISCKFSGNKGFHIGVPFEAFPPDIAQKKVKDLFPELPRKISEYLLDYISQKYIKIDNDKIIFDNTHIFTIPQLNEKFGDKEFLKRKCSECKKNIKQQKSQTTEFICPKCDNRTKIESDQQNQQDYLKCEKCNILMEKIETLTTLCPCGSNTSTLYFEPSAIIEIDTILISSRHLYRMPYSLHEKSGLVSIPIEPNHILLFEKSTAKPENIPLLTPQTPIFMNRNNLTTESGRYLLTRALDFKVKQEFESDKAIKEQKNKKSYDDITIQSPIKEEFFPPCLTRLLQGVEDGKKRSIFILTNFLGKLGWNKDDIDQYIHKWNTEKNSAPLREVYLKSQLHHFIPNERLPPNCNNEGYYKSLNLCHPDAFCRKIKNPANYSLLRWKIHLEQQQDEDEKSSRKRKKKEESNSKENDVNLFKETENKT